MHSSEDSALAFVRFENVNGLCGSDGGREGVSKKLSSKKLQAKIWQTTIFHTFQHTQMHRCTFWASVKFKHLNVTKNTKICTVAGFLIYFSYRQKKRTKGGGVVWKSCKSGGGLNSPVYVLLQHHFRMYFNAENWSLGTTMHWNTGLLTTYAI